jgi:Flp pilus assembly pilin Flp
MGYRVMGRAHAGLARWWTRERGQGTVEYVALILLVAVVLAGVVAATRKTSLGDGGIARTIVQKLKGALDGVT